MKTKINPNITRFCGKVMISMKKYAPDAMISLGIVGIVVGTVYACKKTIEAKHELDIRKEEVKNQKLPEEEEKKELTKETVKVIAKEYAAPTAVMIASIGLIVGASTVYKNRIAAITTAYATLNTAYNEYRDKMKEKLGIEEEKKIHTEMITKNTRCDYSRFYDDGCKGWVNNPEMNLITLRHVQDFCNEKLQARGYLFLNEVYDCLGIPRTKAGQIVGWVYNLKNPNGDNYVDFGIYDMFDKEKRNFVNGYEPVIILDFNVDGNILDLI